MKQPMDETAAASALEQIEQLAHEYWEQEGRPEGRHLEHWLRAEAELFAHHNGNGDG